MPNHHLRFCKESYLQTAAGISTPERAQKVTADCQRTCGHPWHAYAILQLTRLKSLTLTLQQVTGCFGIFSSFPRSSTKLLSL